VLISVFFIIINGCKETVCVVFFLTTKRSACIFIDNQFGIHCSALLFDLQLEGFVKIERGGPTLICMNGTASTLCTITEVFRSI
jgi:hypothetical protein